MSVGGKAEDGIVSRYINRRISTKISGFIISHWSDPNPFVATVVSLFAGVLAGAAYIYTTEFVGGILAQLASILDGVDGELARATGKTSRLGAFIDTLLDRVVDFVILISIYYSFFKVFMGDWLYPSMIYFYSVFAWIMVSYFHSVLRSLDGERRIQTGLYRFASRDVRIFIVFIFSLFGLGFYGVVLAGLVSTIYLVYSGARIYHLLR